MSILKQLLQGRAYPHTMTDSLLPASIASARLLHEANDDRDRPRSHQLFISRSFVMREQAPARAGTLASDKHGAFPLLVTFDRLFRLGSQIRVDCWIDAASAQRNKFAVSLARRAAAVRATWGAGDQALSCISKCLGQGATACASAAGAMSAEPAGTAPNKAPSRKVPLKMVLMTAPTLFQPGDQLVLTITLAGARGCEMIRQGALFFGGDSPSVCILEELETADAPEAAEPSATGAA